MKKVALLLSAILLAAPIAPAHADEESFTVMSRNIYLGADNAPALYPQAAIEEIRLPEHHSISIWILAQEVALK
jgi:hypothetical protein